MAKQEEKATFFMKIICFLAGLSNPFFAAILIKLNKDTELEYQKEYLTCLNAGIRVFVILFFLSCILSFIFGFIAGFTGAA